MATINDLNARRTRCALLGLIVAAAGSARDNLGSEPVGQAEHNHGQPIVTEKTPGRNAPCPCGSGKKFKHCHMKQGGK